MRCDSSMRTFCIYEYWSTPWLLRVLCTETWYQIRASARLIRDKQWITVSCKVLALTNSNHSKFKVRMPSIQHCSIKNQVHLTGLEFIVSLCAGLVKQPINLHCADRCSLLKHDRYQQLTSGHFVNCFTSQMEQKPSLAYGLVELQIIILCNVGQSSCFCLSMLFHRQNHFLDQHLAILVNNTTNKKSYKNNSFLSCSFFCCRGKVFKKKWPVLPLHWSTKDKQQNTATCDVHKVLDNYVPKCKTFLVYGIWKSTKAGSQTRWRTSTSIDVSVVLEFVILVVNWNTLRCCETQ